MQLSFLIKLAFIVWYSELMRKLSLSLLFSHFRQQPVIEHNAHPHIKNTFLIVFLLIYPWTQQKQGPEGLYSPENRGKRNKKQPKFSKLS